MKLLHQARLMAVADASSPLYGFALSPDGDKGSQAAAASQMGHGGLRACRLYAQRRRLCDRCTIFFVSAEPSQVSANWHSGSRQSFLFVFSFPGGSCHGCCLRAPARSLRESQSVFLE